MAYITAARKAKSSDKWFVGCVAGNTPHKSQLTLSFLDKGRKYEATIYTDAPNANYRSNPKAYRIERRTVTSATKLSLTAVAGGGYAMSIVPKK